MLIRFNSILSEKPIFTVSPNPAVDYVDIVYDSSKSYISSARLEVYNLEGILVSRQELRATGIDQKFSVKDFEAGSYLFKIILDEHVHVEKITIVD